MKSGLHFLDIAQIYLFIPKRHIFLTDAFIVLAKSQLEQKRQANGGLIWITGYNCRQLDNVSARA